MSSDEIIRQVINRRGFYLARPNLDDEQITLELAEHLKKIAKVGTKVASLIGGAASGKTQLARRVAHVLRNTATISTDDFLLGSRDYRRTYLEGGDSSRKYDFDLLREKVACIQNLRPGESEPVPVYNEVEGTAIKILDYDRATGRVISIEKEHYEKRIGKVEFLIVEGDFQPLLDCDCQIFFHVPDDVRLQNRINRDVKRRNGVNGQEIIGNFGVRQTLQHTPYTLPCASNADIIITVKAIPKNLGYQYQHSVWLPHLGASRAYTIRSLP